MMATARPPVLICAVEREPTRFDTITMRPTSETPRTELAVAAQGLATLAIDQPEARVIVARLAGSPPRPGTARAPLPIERFGPSRDFPAAQKTHSRPNA